MHEHSPDSLRYRNRFPTLLQFIRYALAGLSEGEGPSHALERLALREHKLRFIIPILEISRQCPRGWIIGL